MCRTTAAPLGRMKNVISSTQHIFFSQFTSCRSLFDFPLNVLTTVHTGERKLHNLLSKETPKPVGKAISSTVMIFHTQHCSDLCMQLSTHRQDGQLYKHT